MNFRNRLLATTAFTMNTAEALGGSGTPPAGTPPAGTPPAGTPPAGGGDPWWSSFQNPEVKSLMQTKNYANVEALASSYANLSKLQSGAKDVFALPAKDDDADGWNKVFSALGRPAKPEEYTFKFGDDVKIDPKLEGFAKTMFHGLGASPARAQAAADQWNAFVKQMNDDAATAQKAADDKAIGDLKTAWGAKWDENIASGQKAVRALGLDDDALGQLDASMGSPAVMKLMATIGKKLGVETPIPNGGGNGNIGGMTKEQAKSEIATLTADKDFQTSIRTINPQREANLARWTELHRIAG